MSFFNNPTTTAQSGFSFGGGSGFNLSKTTASSGGGLFGASATTQAAPSLFGATPIATTSSGLFGSTTAQPATGFGKPAIGGGLFGTAASATTQAQPGGFNFTSTPAAPKTTQASLGGGFNFSNTPASTQASTAGFSLSNNTTTTQAPAGFGAAFGAQPAAKPAGFSFATPATAASQPTGGFGFSNQSATTTTQAAAPGFSFTTSTPAVASTQAASVGFAFNPTSTAPKTAVASEAAGSNAASGGFKLGNLSATKPLAASTGFQLSTNKPAGDATKPASQGLFGLGTKPAATTAATNLGFNLASSTTAATQAATGFQLSSAATSKPSTGFQLSSSTAAGSAPASGGLLGGLSTSTASTGLKLGAPTATIKPTTTSASTGGFQLSTASATSKSAAVTSATATTTTSDSVASGSLRFKDLEVMINKWTSELEGQERLFIDQATLVNGWNKLLIDNSHKITGLHDEFEKMQCDQERLNQNLDFIKTQQQELEDLIRPLEETLRQQSVSHVTSIHTHHADLEREKTYGLVANIDGQLKHMVGDLREIIDHINTTSLTSTDNANPINQISKILSAHMDSLQWLDSNSSSLECKLEELSKQVNDRKQEQESKFRLAFD